MPTPRSESIAKSVHGETFIHTPHTKYDAQNKVDHYAVLAQIINTGVDCYLDDPAMHVSLTSANTFKSLDHNLRIDLESVLLTTLQSDTFTTHHKNLSVSQTQRERLDPPKYSTVESSLIAGISTFSYSLHHIFESLYNTVGLEEATHVNNWHIPDRLAKLHIDQFSAYYSTYLTEPKNLRYFLNHIEPQAEGGIRFKQGYPGNALVTTSSVSHKNIQFGSDFDVSGSQPLVAIKDINLAEVTIGCPVTFESYTIKKLWSLYAEQAYRLSCGSNSDDIEASAQ